MWHVAVRGFVGKRSLAHACKDMLNVNVAKDDGVRLTFKRDTALDLDHLIYAGEDPVYTWRLHKAISEDYTKAEKYHTQGAIALADISRRGMLVDEERRAKLEGKYQELIKGCLDVLEMNGYVPGQKGNKKVLAARLTEMESTYNIKFMRTEKTGQISTTDESLAAIGDVDIPFLNALKNHDHYNKMVSSYLKTDILGADGRAHPRPDPFVKTGRTSFSKPPVQQFPRKEGIRGIFIPPPGYVYNACDYSQLELCTLSQHCLVDYGFSKLAETINSGVDCHKVLAAAIYNKSYDDVKKAERQLAKIAGFGFMGGLAAETFISYAKGYGVVIDLKTSEHVRDTWIKTYPEMEQHLKPPRSADGDWYTARNILGMIRGRCSYTETCNYSQAA
jgi:DNA polymerase I-like protein with 3'-5' exonuclease and polymerase domains